MHKGNNGKGAMHKGKGKSGNVYAAIASIGQVAKNNKKCMKVENKNKGQAHTGCFFDFVISTLLPTRAKDGSNPHANDRLHRTFTQ